MSVKKYQEQIYAGVLGKLLGVYLGRPVEGWSYEKITETFDEVKYYIHEQVGVPLIVADDDISGTFAFFKALEDNDYNPNLTAKDFGDTWLNYIIENKTILWWGGLGRSTEHTAFLNLKNGIEAPKSGSIEQNEKTLAEQIGAQIFIDAIAMACPNNPNLAVDLVRKVASVSHDGIAVEAACHLAALQAMAFCEKDLDKLLDKSITYVNDKLLIEIINDVRNICKKESDWRKVRAYLDPKYGYDVFVGCCHMVPNHAMVLASILLAGDDFQKSISIASSAAWDTDCNAGNVGAFNGIRLGLAGINSGADFRTPVADLMYVVNSDGGSVVTDAVIESKKIIKAAAKLVNEEISISKERYTFEFQGSLQGFHSCDYGENTKASVILSNWNEFTDNNGLLIECRHLADGVAAAVSTQTFIDFSKVAHNFSTVASPTLYGTQKIKTKVLLIDSGEITLTPYILYYDLNDNVQKLSGEEIALSQIETTFIWEVPDTKGMSIFKLGYELKSEKRFDGRVVIRSIDWKDAPKRFAQEGMLMTSIWNTNPLWLAGFASSAAHFAADFKRTYCVSHIEDDGLVTIGTQDWENYSVSTKIYFNLHKSGGLVLRSKGHKRYYGAILNEYKQAIIFVQKDGVREVLCEIPYSYKEDKEYHLKFTARDKELLFAVNGKILLMATDTTYSAGGAGFIISKGTMTCDGFVVEG